MVVAFYFRLHLAYFPRPVVAIFARPEHHLITRGAAIESIAPLTKVLTETEFYAFAEKALAVLEIKGLLMEAVNEHNRAEQKEGC